jgi:pyruvyltransferase
MNILSYSILIALLLFVDSCVCLGAEPAMFWWRPEHGNNFGDHLSKVIVERILGHPVKFEPLTSKDSLLFGAGSILHFAKNGDVIWGSGFRENPLLENGYTELDVRAVRGPRTRDFLLQKGIPCPKVYGDPAILISHLFPEFKREEPVYDYIIIPNLGELELFQIYKNVVSPLEDWDEIIRKMLKSKLVISSSLHGIIVAESFGIPTRFLKMTWVESLLKYQDYYESTNRPGFQFATSVQEALQMEGEKPGYIDPLPLLEAFPWDYFGEEKR